MQLKSLQAHDLPLELLLNVVLAVDGDEDAVQRFTKPYSSLMPPTVASPVRPVGQPPEDLHHEQEEQIAAPFAPWVSQDYNPGNNFTQEEDQEYYTKQEPEEYDYFDDDYYLGDENQQW